MQEIVDSNANCGWCAPCLLSLQLNFQRDQIAAIKDKKLGKEEKKDSERQDNLFSGHVAQTSQAHSTIAGMTESARNDWIDKL